MRSFVCFALIALVAAQENPEDLTPEELEAAARAARERVSGFTEGDRNTDGATDTLEKLKSSIETEEVDDEALYYRLLYIGNNATADRIAKQVQCASLEAMKTNDCDKASELQSQFASFAQVYEWNSANRTQELAVIAKLEHAVAKLNAIGTEDLETSAADQFLALLEDDEDVKASTLVDICETVFRASENSSAIQGFLIELKNEINAEEAEELLAKNLLQADRDDYTARCIQYTAAALTCDGVQRDMQSVEVAALQRLNNHNETWQEMIPIRIEEKRLLDTILDKLAEIKAIRNLEFGDVDLQVERVTNMTMKIKKVLNDLIFEIRTDNSTQHAQKQEAISVYDAAASAYNRAVATTGAAQGVVDGVNRNIETKQGEIDDYRAYHGRRDAMRSKESQLIDRLEEFAEKLSTDEAAEAAAARRAMLAALTEEAEAIPVEQQEALAGAIAELRYQISQEEAAEELALDTLEAQMLCLQNGQDSGDLWTCQNPALHLEYAEGELADAQEEEAAAKLDKEQKDQTKFDWIALYMFESAQRAKEEAGLNECIDIVVQMEKEGRPCHEVVDRAEDACVADGGEALGDGKCRVVANEPVTFYPWSQEACQEKGGTWSGAQSKCRMVTPCYPVDENGERSDGLPGRRALQVAVEAQVDMEMEVFRSRNTSAKVFNMLNALKESIQQEQRDDDDFVARTNFTKIQEEANEYDANVERSRRETEAARTLSVKNGAIATEASKLEALRQGNETRELEKIDIEGMKVVVQNLNNVENVTSTALAQVDDLEPEEFATMLTELETEQSRAYSASEVIMNVLNDVLDQREREMMAQVADWRAAQDWRALKTAEDDLAQAAWGAATAAWNAQVIVMRTKTSEYETAVANNEEITPQRAHEIILIDAMITKIKEFQAKRAGTEDLEKRSKGSQKIRKFLTDMKDFLEEEDRLQLEAIDHRTEVRSDASNTRALAENALAVARSELADATTVDATKTENEATRQGEWDLGEATRANETAAVLEIRDLLKTLHFDAVAPGQEQTVELVGDEALTLTQANDMGKGVYFSGSYKLEFKLKLDGTTNAEWSNILHYGDDAEERVPALYVVPSTLRLAFQHDSAGGRAGVEPAAPLVANEEMSIKIVLREDTAPNDDQNENVMKVYWGPTNTDPSDEQGAFTLPAGSNWEFRDHKKLWIADPWAPAASGTIRNLKLTQGRPVTTASMQLRRKTGHRMTAQALLQMGGKRISRTHKASYVGHPLFGPILMQIRNQARPGAEKKIHAALDSFEEKLRIEKEGQRAALDLAISEANSAAQDKDLKTGTRDTRVTEKSRADDAYTEADARLKEATAIFDENDPIRDEEMEVLDEILAILDRFEGVGNGSRGNVEANGENIDVCAVTDGSAANPRTCDCAGETCPDGALTCDATAAEGSRCT